MLQSSQLILDHYRLREKTLAPIVDKLTKIMESTHEEMEGNCFFHGTEAGKPLLQSWFFIFKRVNYMSVIKDFNVERICEIGLNAGHSMACFLQTLPSTGHVQVFDLCDHKYTKPCFAYLKEKYPQIKELVEGDSKQTLRAWINKNPQEVGSYDLVHVDGGHYGDTPMSDVIHADILLRPGGIMVLDDTQLQEIITLIPFLLSKGYAPIVQIPTFCLSHALFQKSA